MDNPHKQAEVDFVQEVSKLIFENQHSALGQLWEKLDINAKDRIVEYIEYFIGHKADKAVVDWRRGRADLVEKALNKQIALLRKAHTERLSFEEIELLRWGKVVTFGDPFWPQEHGPLSTILSTEILRLSKLLGKVKRLYNMKRFGVSGKIYWLVYAQEFLRSWSSRHVGQVLELTSTHLADLIDAALTASGQHPDNPSDPEKIGKALVHFRKNPANKTFCDLIQRQFPI